jgi:hypothetical protein
VHVRNDECELLTDAWIDLQLPDLGISCSAPPHLQPLSFREGERRGLMLTSAPDAWRQALVLIRGPAIGGATAAWQAEAQRLADAPDWSGAVEAGPYPIAVDGVSGLEGWLRFRDARGEALVGLLWVGEAGESG